MGGSIFLVENLKYPFCFLPFLSRVTTHTGPNLREIFRTIVHLFADIAFCPFSLFFYLYNVPYRTLSIKLYALYINDVSTLHERFSVKIMRKERGEEEKKIQGKKKAVAFFHIEIIIFLFSLFLRTEKVSWPSLNFHVGVTAKMPWSFSD